MKTINDINSGLTAEILRMLVLYDPATGEFHWRESGSGRGGWKRKAGARAGWADKHYRKIQLPGYEKYFLEHRLAWLWMIGEWPEVQIDHINNNGHDNRWENLREADNGENQHNRGLRPHNRSGYTGVSQNGTGWLAELVIDGERVLCKTVRTKEEAIQLRQEAEQRFLVGIKHSS